MIQTMLKQDCPIPAKASVKVFLIALGALAQERCFNLLHDIRQQGVSAQMDFSGRKLAKVMQQANQIGAEYVVVMGDEELQKGQVELKEMASGQKNIISIDELVTTVSRR